MRPGIYKITNDNYHNHFCDEPTLSTGVIKKLLDNPKRAWHDNRLLNPQYVKPVHERKFDLGSAVHDYVLEGGDAIEVITGFFDWKKSAARDLADLAWQAGKIPLLEKQFEQVQEISASVVAAIRDCSELGITDLKTDGEAELTYLWEEDGVWLKCRPDYLHNDKRVILDLKNLGHSADPEKFGNHAVDMGYDAQDSVYRRGVRTMHGHECGYNGPEFVFILCEIKPPYLACTWSFSAQGRALGDDKVDMAIKLWKKCLRDNHFPGYPTDRICWGEVKPWNIAAWESKKLDINRILEGN